MRVMLDSSVWVDLEQDEDFLEDFRTLYDERELDVIFSVGNFLDLIGRENREDLAPVIDEFTDEYLAPLQIDLEGEYRFSASPLILSTIDAEWYEHCKRETRGLDDLETLETLFREANFSDGPVLSRVSRFVEEYREIENSGLEGQVETSDGVSRGATIKKIRTFPEYVSPKGGKMALDDESVPLKRYIIGMSMVYVSETQDEADEEDYRSAVTWSQAIIAGCDVLWTDREWESDHPLVDQVVERLDREYVEFAEDFEEFESLVSA